ncbi:MAG: ParB/RepB/Spo0J family partition protein [Acidobacteria bacterium]|nr:ParB/RepB/Spo0J family partition protein [Acidobacteriota bacterium]
MSIKRGLPTTLKMRHDRHYVEELSALRGAPIGKMIAVEKLQPNPQQPRVDMGDLEDLIASIKEKGILEPLLVRPSDVGGRYMIISGERRYRAALEAELREVPCIEMDVDERNVAEIALIENLQRKDLTAYEEAEGFLALIERFGYTHEEVAKKIGKSRSSITEALSIAAIPADVRDKCRAESINSKSLLLQVARQSDHDSMINFVQRIASQGMNRDEARQARKNKQVRAQPFVYRFQSPGKDFSIEVKFRRSSVEHDELVRAVRTALEELGKIEQSPAKNNS